ncbi:MAG: hypothetical protein RL094_161 [Candidatus Parcubacteria bacterium]|jgi:hypothetical protein
MKTNQTRLMLAALWLLTFFTATARSDTINGYYGYTVAPARDDYPDYPVFQTWSIDFQGSLYNGADSPSQGVPHSYKLFRSGGMHVEAHRLISSVTTLGLWESEIDANRPPLPGETQQNPFNIQKGNQLVLGIRLQSQTKFRLKDIVYGVGTTSSSGIFGYQKDMAAQATFKIPFILGRYYGADGIAGTPDDVSYGNFTPNTAPINEITIIIGQGINMDAETGTTDAERLHKALSKFNEDFQVWATAKVWPYDDSRTTTPFEVTGPQLTVLAVNPIIRTAPTSQSARRGHNATFTVSATGKDLSYQWFRDGATIDGATSASYTISSVTDADDAAQLRVTVTNSFGEAVSDDVSLTVTPPFAPTAVTGSASGVTTNSAVLSGTVNTNEEPSTVWWIEYGDNNSYSNLTPLTALQTSADMQQVSVAIGDLIPRRDYMFRIVAQGPGGTTYGEDHFFTTATPTQPFLGVSGTFQGLIGDNGEGMMNITLAKTGKFTAVVSFGGKRYSVKGRFDNDGKFLVQLGKSGLLLSLSLDVYDTGELTGGIVGAGGGDVQFVRRAVYSRKNPAPQTGDYTLLAHPTEIVGPIPQGDASLLMKVTKTGHVTLVGKLPDNTPISQGGALATDNSFRVFTRPGRKGVIAGFVAFEATTTKDLSGDLYWNKPANEKAKQYPQGFAASLSAEGSRYVAEPWTQSCPPASLSLERGNLLSEINRSLTGTPKGFVVQNPGGEGLQLKRTSRGLVTGSFVHPLTNKRVPLRGVLLQKSGGGGGYFVGPQETGSVVVELATGM